MRNFKSMLIALLGTVVFLCSTTFFVFADDGGEGIGEYVSESAPHGHGAAIPAGHYGLIAKYADKFLSNPPGPHRTIFADTLIDGIDDINKADELTDFFLLDIRKSADFCAGHIPSIVDGYPIDIVNIPFEEVAKPENLAMLQLIRLSWLFVTPAIPPARLTLYLTCLVTMHGHFVLV